MWNNTKIVNEITALRKDEETQGIVKMWIDPNKFPCFSIIQVIASETLRRLTLYKLFFTVGPKALTKLLPSQAKETGVIQPWAPKSS